MTEISDKEKLREVAHRLMGAPSICWECKRWNPRSPLSPEGRAGWCHQDMRETREDDGCHKFVYGMWEAYENE